MRPIASNIRAPSSKIAEYLIRTFNKLNPPKGMYIKNSLELVDQIKDLKIKRNEVLVSFDVESLYPSIPRKIALEYLERWLLREKLPQPIIQIYVEMASICINQSYVMFNDKVYNLSDGVAMGNPISSFIANLFMCYSEIELSSSNKFPRVWIRYVDDIFSVMNKRLVPDTLKFLNDQHASIKYTYELEKNDEISFLDLKIIKIDDSLSFKIHRKPTMTDRFIPSNSYNNLKHKQAAFYSMIHRLIFIPMTQESYHQELNKIYEIADINGYTKLFIDKILDKKIKQKTLMDVTTHSIEQMPKKRIAITYSLESTQIIKNIFKNHKIEIVAKNQNKLKNKLRNAKDKINTIDKSGVYRIQCGSIGCTKSYIGETKRKIKTRFKEHLDAHLKGKPEKSSVAEHMIEYDHKFDEDNLVLLKECYESNKLKIYESMFIKKENENDLMNADRGPIHSKLFSLKY